MFGENYMLGIARVKPDEKGRIVLPKFTEVEKDDILVLIQKEDYLEVWNRVTLVNILKELEEKIKNASTEEEKQIHQNNFNKMIILVVAGYRKVFFHSKKLSMRINLEKRMIEQYDLSGGAVIEARGNYLRLWNSLKFETYKNSLGELNLEKSFSLDEIKKLSKVKKIPNPINKLEDVK